MNQPRCLCGSSDKWTSTITEAVEAWREWDAMPDKMLSDRLVNSMHALDEFYTRGYNPRVSIESKIELVEDSHSEVIKKMNHCELTEDASLKMYILIKRQTPRGIAIVSAAHASLAVYLKFKESKEVSDWLKWSFKKVVCTVTNEEFEESKKYEDYVVMTESKLDNQAISIGFKPRVEWPVFFRTLRLYNDQDK